MQQALLTITGRVQGVFFRGETRTEAMRLKINGYAKNNADGSVTILAIGQEVALKNFIEWCKNGPAGAIVEHVEIHYQKPQVDKFESFDIF